jgi:hypothetical protein
VQGFAAVEHAGQAQAAAVTESLRLAVEGAARWASWAGKHGGRGGASGTGAGLGGNDGQHSEL